MGGAEEQTRVAIDHIEAILKTAGTRLDLVVRTTVWLRTLSDFDAMNRAYRARFPRNPPARVTVAAADLFFSTSVEIDAIAAMPDVNQPK